MQIDADHSYAAVQADAAAWWPKVRAGGYLCGDDYGNPGCAEVRPAVDEWAGRRGLTVEKYGKQSWVIRK